MSLSHIPPFQVRGGHAFSSVMLASVRRPSWVLKVMAGVLWISGKIPPVPKYIVSDLLLMEGKRVRSRESSLNLGRRGKIVNQVVGHEHIALRVRDVMKMDPFIALFNPRSNQEQDFQCIFLCRVDGWIH